MKPRELNKKLEELNANSRAFLDVAGDFAALVRAAGHSPATLVAAAQACIEIARDSEISAGRTDEIVAAVSAGHATFRAERMAKSS